MAESKQNSSQSEIQIPLEAAEAVRRLLAEWALRILLLAHRPKTPIQETASDDHAE
jgi:hypothetical protein